MGAIAVVAVHGVGDQKPDETARAVAALIASGAPPQAMAPALARKVVVPIDRPVELDPTVACEPDIELTRELTQGYEPDAQHRAYETTCYELGASPASGEKRVHVYELYWADLSRLAPGVWRILSELYQVLFHLASLGHRVVAAAGCAQAKSPDKLLRACLYGAERCTHFSLFALSAPIFFLNVALLVVYLTLSAAIAPAQSAFGLVVAACAVLALLGVGLVMYFRRPPPRPPWVALGCLCVLAALALGVALACGVPAGVAVCVVALFAATALGLYLAMVFSERRPGTAAWGYAIVLGTGAALLVLLAIAGVQAVGQDDVLPAIAMPAGRVSEVLMITTIPAWLAKLVFDAAFFVFAGLLMWRTRGARAHSPQARIRTALKTAALGTMLSTTGFMLITLSMWGALDGVARNALASQSVPYHALLPHWSDEKHATLLGLGSTFITRSSIYYPVAVWVSGALLVMLLCAIVPSLLAEFLPPHAYSAGRQRRLGTWLTANLDDVALVVSGVVGLYLALAVAYVVLAPFDSGPPPATLAMTIGHVIAGATVGLLALGRRLDKTIGKARVALDILLDVDNYLREHPFERNPRSTIQARLHGLVDYVRSQGYDAIVFVAHSQGTVIVADYLRTLHANPERRDHRGQPWQYLSFGSPLRQLYTAHFPHWYAWIPDTADECARVASMGLDRWVNLYGAGDYVGRRVFAENDLSDGFGQPAPEQLARAIEEQPTVDACVGTLAHLHYIDGHAPLVAVALRRMLALAVPPLPCGSPDGDDHAPLRRGLGALHANATESRAREGGD